MQDYYPPVSLIQHSWNPVCLFLTWFCPDSLSLPNPCLTCLVVLFGSVTFFYNLTLPPDSALDSPWISDNLAGYSSWSSCQSLPSLVLSHCLSFDYWLPARPNCSSNFSDGILVHTVLHPWRHPQTGTFTLLPSLFQYCEKVSEHSFSDCNTSHSLFPRH